MSEREAARAEIAAWVDEQGFLPGGGGLVVGPWQVLDFSSVYSVQRVGPDSRAGVFVKIPKSDFRRRTVLPICVSDREMAEEEYRSLRYLEDHWPADGAARYVRPLAFCRRYSAIVTRRSYASDMFLSWRRHDLHRRIGLDAANPLRDWLVNLGRALREYHEASSREEGQIIKRRLGDPIAKIAASISRLRFYGADVSTVAKMAEGLRHFEGMTIESPSAMTLKGLDLRNVLLEEHGLLTLLDPGRLKLDDPVADVARLVATCRILYWGSGWLLLGLRPSKMHEADLLEGYGAVDERSLELLDLYLVKELFKQWVAAYVTIERKTWPTAIKRVLRRTYVDRFYRNELRIELSRVMK